LASPPFQDPSYRDKVFTVPPRTGQIGERILEEEPLGDLDVIDVISHEFVADYWGLGVPLR
jgi:hypothetical protein